MPVFGSPYLNGFAMERRLAAILAADVVGYSRLMGEDEAGTHAALKTHFVEFLMPKIADHIGRVVKTTGDGLLAEFASAVAAVQCAVALQRGMADRNKSVAEAKRLTFRIGINVGDIIVEDKDIFGDGVIIAARLESLADPGGICISRTVRDQVRDKLPFEFADLGEQVVKNITRAVRVFGLDAEGIAALPESPVAPPSPSRRRAPVWVGIGVAALIVVGVAFLFRPQSSRISPSDLPTSWPSIALQPFVSLSDDKSQAYFSAGIPEALSVDLGRLPHLVVIQGTAPWKDAESGPAHGARYTVSGTVRRTGEQVRITVHLVEAATGNQVGAWDYDRPATDIFAVQDQMFSNIAQTVMLNISHEDLERSKQKPPTSSLSAYELYLRAREASLLNTPDDTARAIELYKQAIAADPSYADALGALSQAYFEGFNLHRGPLRGQQAIDLAYDTARRGFVLDPTSVYVVRSLAIIYLFTHRIDEAIALMEKLQKSNPSNDAVLLRMGDIYTYAGQPERGIDLLRQVYQLNPRYSGAGHAFIGRGLLLLDRHEEAVAELKACSLALPAFRVCHEIAAVAYAEMGRLEEARVEAMEAHRLDPEFTIATAPNVLPFKNPKDLERFIDGLRKAGLPE